MLAEHERGTNRTSRQLARPGALRVLPYWWRMFLTLVAVLVLVDSTGPGREELALGILLLVVVTEHSALARMRAVLREKGILEPEE